METFRDLRESHSPCYGDSKLPHEVLDEAIDELEDIAMMKKLDGWKGSRYDNIFNYWSNYLWNFHLRSEDVEYCVIYNTTTDSWEYRVDGKRIQRGNGIQEYIEKCKGF